MISTVVSSVAGGAAVVQKFGLQAWTHDYIGRVALLGARARLPGTGRARTTLPAARDRTGRWQRCPSPLAASRSSAPAGCVGFACWL